MKKRIPLLYGGMLLMAACPAVLAAPYLSELLALGNTTTLDEDGDTPDWLEIHNPDALAFDLGGHYLTDDPADLTKWAFPATSLAAGDHLVVFASDKDRAVAGLELHTNFKLSSGGEYFALVDPDGTTVISEFTPAFPQQVTGYSYGIANDLTAGYFENPSPGVANGAVLGAPLLGPTISPAGATYTSTVQVTLGSPTFPGGQIRYTTDGSAPIISSTLYPGPLTFSTTTHLRAAVFDPGSGDSGAVAGAQFVKLASSSDFAGLDAPANFTSDHPIIVFENFGAGAVPSSSSNSFQTGRITVFEVDQVTGRSALGNLPDADLRIGIRERGRTSGGFDKHQYRVELRDELDEDLDYALLGLPSESDWVFNGPWVDKSLIRNPMAFALGDDIGIQSSRFKYFEMFLNTDGGDLASSEYIGVYVLLEKIKDGKNRTDLANLDAGDNAEPEITGGYLMSFENGSLGVLEPDPSTSTQRNWIEDYVEEFARETLGWTSGGPNDTGLIDNDPVTGYPAYIDIDSFIHLMVMNELLCEQDAYVRSDYMYKDRGGKLHKGPLWDYNLSAGTGTSGNTNEVWFYERTYNRHGQSSSYLSDMLVPLMRDPDFRQRFIDRWSELRTSGVLQTPELSALIDGLADPLSESASRNFTRWPVLDVTLWASINTNTWEEQIDAVKDWMTARIAWIDGALPQGVVFSHSSGVRPAGTVISLTGVGTVYYTLDGSDPRAPGGLPGSSAVSLGSGGTVTVNSSIDIIARCFDGTDWSAPSRVTSVVGTPADATNLAITELNYHPSDPTAAEIAADPTYRDDDFEFIELRNISTGPIELGGMAFIDGIEFVVPASTVLPSGAFALLVENAAAFEERYGSGHPVIGVYANKMKNDGETLRLVDVSGADIAHFTFNDIWYPTTDGEGHTLTLTDDLTIPADYGSPLAWEASSVVLGAPGASGGAFALWLASTTGTAYNEADVSCYANGDTDAVTVYWGTGDPGETTVGWTGTPIDLGAQATGSVPATITGLSENTTYFFRYFGSITSPAEDAWSPAGTFTTPLQNPAPLLGTPVVTATYLDGADVQCQLQDAFATSIWVVWGTADQGTPASPPGAWANASELGTALEGAILSKAIMGADSDTSYVFRFFASNATGSDWSELGTFDTDAPPPSAAAVAHYLLDGDSQDSSGNNYDGVDTNVSYVGDGVRGTVASFDGLTSSINLTTSFPYSLGDQPNGQFSTSFWILPTVNNGSNSTPDTLIIMGGSSPGKGVIEIVGDTSWGGMGGTSARGGVGVNSGGGGGKTGKVGSIDLYDGDWHHVVIQWAGDPNTDIEVWIDNTAATTYGNGYNGSSDGLTALRLGGPAVGSNGGAADKYYTGLMSDVQFFAGQLDASQVNALFTGASVIETNGEVVAEALTGPGGPFVGQSDPNVVGFTANPDGDQWLNAFEVLLGFDPAAGGDGAPLSTQFVDDAGQTWFEVLVEVDAAMDDLLTWHIEWSSNLVDWDESSNARVVVGESDGVRTVSVRDDQPVSANSERFYRLKILPGE